MAKFSVAITRYEKKLESVRRAVELSNALKNLPKNGRVFIKPNIVFWTKAAPFPKWGVITTSRMVEDMIIILKDHGIDDITIGDGTITINPEDRETTRHAFNYLGYAKLKKRYGIQYFNLFERPFERVDLGMGVHLNINSDIMHSDFVIDIPVLKTHAQTIVSLSIKNLKGALNIASRKKCHSADPDRDLNFMISRIPEMLPPSAAVIDGIYSMERGPAMDGMARRSNIIIASSDIFSADMVGARVLGYQPSEIPYLALIAEDKNRPCDLSDIEVAGERIKDVESFHQYTFPYNRDSTLPAKMEQMGLKGVSYYKYDSSLCTYCSFLNGAILTAIAFAWKGEP